MKRILIGTAAALGLASLATPARAADEKTEEHKETTVKNGQVKKKHTAKHSVDTKVRGKVTDSTKAESETKTSPSGSVSTTETTRAHDEKGLAHDHKTKTKTKVEHDKNGSVVHSETKTE